VFCFGGTSLPVSSTMMRDMGGADGIYCYIN
jgi:hypothetical protein